MNAILAKSWARDLIYNIFSWTGLTGFHKTPIHSLTVITFHRVLPDSLRDQYPLPGLAVTPEELRWVLEQITPDFDVRTISDCVLSLKARDNLKPLLAVTFDDGQWDNYFYGRPVLASLEVPAAFYVATDYIDQEQLLWHDQAGFWWLSLGEARNQVLPSLLGDYQLPDNVFTSAQSFVHFLKDIGPENRESFFASISESSCSTPKWSRMMTWKEVAELYSDGHEIGSHSLTHNLLSQLPLDLQKNELIQSQSEISNRLGIKVESLCYPDGRYNEDTLEILSQSSYQSAVTTSWGANPENVDKFQLSRFDINAEHLKNRKNQLSAARFQFRLSRFQPRP